MSSVLTEQETLEMDVDTLARQLKEAQEQVEHYRQLNAGLHRALGRRKDRNKLLTEILRKRGWGKTAGLDLRDPNARPGEAVDGGFIILRRTGNSGRVAPTLWPYEHGSLQAAVAEVNRIHDSCEIDGTLELWKRVNQN